MQYICQAKPVYCHTIFTVTLPTSCWDLVCIKWVKQYSSLKNKLKLNTLMVLLLAKQVSKVEDIDGSATCKQLSAKVEDLDDPPACKLRCQS